MNKYDRAVIEAAKRDYMQCIYDRSLPNPLDNCETCATRRTCDAILARERARPGGGGMDRPPTNPYDTSALARRKQQLEKNPHDKRELGIGWKDE